MGKYSFTQDDANTETVSKKDLLELILQQQTLLGQLQSQLDSQQN